MDDRGLAEAIRRHEERLARDRESLAFAQLADLYRKAGVKTVLSTDDAGVTTVWTGATLVLDVSDTFAPTIDGFPPVTLDEGWQTATFRVPATAWRSGVNHLQLAFAYDARPSDAGIPDGRSLAASVDALHVRVAP